MGLEEGLSMGRPKKAVGYKKVGKTWYYKTSGMTSYKTTGETSKTMAEQYQKFPLFAAV